MSKATSPADESLVAAIASSSLLRDFLHIIDCRPMSNALVRHTSDPEALLDALGTAYSLTTL